MTIEILIKPKVGRGRETEYIISLIQERSPSPGDYLDTYVNSITALVAGIKKSEFKY